MAWLTGWTYRKKITVSHTNIDSDLTDFPLLVRFEDADIGGIALATGYDIIFTSSDGQTLLSYDRQSFSIVDGVANGIFWVKTNLSSSSDTEIYLYYGNGSATDESNAVGVWDDYVAVWHLEESSEPFADATGNGNNIGGTGTQVISAVGYGRDLNNSTYLTRGAGTYTVVGGEDFTVSAWVNPGLYGSFSSGMIHYGATGDIAGNWGIAIGGTGGANIIFREWPNGGLVSDISLSHGIDFTDNVRRYFSITKNLTTGVIKSYYNGGNEISATGTTTAMTAAQATRLLAVGYARHNNQPSKEMDEVRVIKTILSAEWIKFEYANMANLGNELEFSIQESQATPDTLYNITSYFRRMKQSLITPSPMGYYRLGQSYPRQNLRQPYPTRFKHPNITRAEITTQYTSVRAYFFALLENLRTLSITKTIHCDNTIKLDSNAIAVLGTMLGLNIAKQATIATTKDLLQNNTLSDSWLLSHNVNSIIGAANLSTPEGSFPPDVSWLGSIYLSSILNYANKTQLSLANAAPISWGGGTQQILRTEVFNLGWLTTLIESHALGGDIITGVVGSDNFAITHLANLSVARTQALSALAGLDANIEIPVGNIGVSTAGYISLLDYLASTQPTKVFDIEALKSLIISQGLPLGWGMANVVVSKSENVVIDWLAKLIKNNSIVHDNIINLDSSTHIAINSLMNTNITRAYTITNLMGLNRSDTLSIGNIGAVSVGYASLLSYLATVRQGIVFDVSVLKELISSSTISLSNLLKTFPRTIINIELIKQLANSGITPLAWLGLINTRINININLLQSLLGNKIISKERLVALSRIAVPIVAWNSTSEAVVVSKTEDVTIDWLCNLIEYANIGTVQTSNLVLSGVSNIESLVFFATQKILFKEWLNTTQKEYCLNDGLLNTLDTAGIVPVLWGGAAAAYPTPQKVWILDARGNQWILTNRLDDWVLEPI